MRGPAPFGMRWTDGRLVPDPAEIGTVRDLVEAFVTAGGRAKTAAAALNAGASRTRRGTQWTDIAVARVIRNPALRDLVSEDQWKRLSELLQARKAAGSAPNRQAAHPLGGLTRCACGGRMYLRGDGPGGKFCCRICRAKVAQDTLERLLAEGIARVELSALEVVEASAGNPRAAELTRILGGEPVALSEIWPALDRDQARQLVDLLVDRIVVGRDEVSIVLAENDGSALESAPSPVNSLPSEHGSEADGNGSTNGLAQAPSRPAGSREDLPLLLPVEQAAEVLHTTPKAVYAMVQRGLLPGVVRVGRRVLIRRDELLDSVRGSRAPSPKEVRR